VIEVKLTDSELLLLDGRVSETVQAEIDAAKRRAAIAHSEPSLLAGQVALVEKIVRRAEAQGRLTCDPVSIRSCDACGRKDGYYVYARTTKSHRKGDVDYGSPKTFTGVDFGRGFVVVEGYATLGCCASCKDAIAPTLKRMLENVRAEIPERMFGMSPRFKRYDNRKCKKCGWEGHEGQMGKLRTLMGDGWYPGVCPQCSAQNILFSTVVDVAPGHAIVEASP
jgi:hypothetical protein